LTGSCTLDLKSTSLFKDVERPGLLSGVSGEEFISQIIQDIGKIYWPSFICWLSTGAPLSSQNSLSFFQNSLLSL
jgi:hypothetical protein